MAETTTTKPINLAQLSKEVGAALSARTDDSGSTIRGDCDQAALDAAVGAHVAVDEESNAAALRERLRQAVRANRDYLALTNPTAAQTTAQAKSLTRQMVGLIRLINNQLDGTD